MIIIKSKSEIDKMRKAGKIVYDTHQYLKKYIKAGISTKKLNDLADKYITSRGADLSFKGLYGFPGSICISINDEVVHGIPSSRVLKEGDLVKIDIGACFEGYHGDSAWTYPVGKISDEAQHLLEHTEKALYEGIKEAKLGNRIGDISFAIESYAKEHKLAVVKELVGHGVGKEVHEDPNVPNFGKKGSGPLLKEGMTIAIEPMLNLGSPEIYILDDDWTIVSDDSSLSAHFEHTIAITKDKAIILTGEWLNG